MLTISNIPEEQLVYNILSSYTSLMKIVDYNKEHQLTYEVSILCMGTEMRCLEKADKYSEKLSLSSTEDESFLVKNCKLYFDSLLIVYWFVFLYLLLLFAAAP